MIVANNDTIHQIVRDEITRLGKDADLNHIDVSQVTDMSHLFNNTEFHGDISEWDVSSVEHMEGMFYGCWAFNCDISGWNVSNVNFMHLMFLGCASFNQDLSSWDVNNVKHYRLMFWECPIKEDYKPKF